MAHPQPGHLNLAINLERGVPGQDSYPDLIYGNFMKITLRLDCQLLYIYLGLQ